MDSRRLNRRFLIEEQSTTQDAAGQPVNTWTEVATVWADIRNKNGLEAIKADAPTSTVTASVRIRYRTDINAGMRGTYDGAVYNILAVLPDLEKKRHTDLVCEVVS